MGILANFAGVALFLVGVLAVYFANFKPLDRCKQLLLPPVALVYGLVCLVVLIGADESLRAFAANLASSIPGWNAENVAGVAVLEAIVFNFMFLVMFLFVKYVYKLIVILISTVYEKGLHRLISAFYVYDEEYGHWFLRDRYQGTRKLFRNIYIAVLAISSVLFFAAMLLALSGIGAGTFRNVFYPAFPVLVLGEVCYCLSGITKTEYFCNAQFEDDGANRIFQYAKMQEALRHYFDDLLIQYGSRSERKPSPLTNDDFCKQLIESESEAARLAGGYFKSLVDKGIISKSDSQGKYDELNRDLALETVNLMEGRSVLFASPFYGDFTPYVFLPVVSDLLRERKVLILYGPNASDEQLAKFAQEGMAFVTSIPDMWTVGKLFEGADDKIPDVGLLPFSYLGNVKDIITHKNYFEQVSLVLVIDPSSLLATYQIGISFLSEYLACGTPVRYCVFDRNSDGLLDSLSHAFKTNMTEVSATEFAEGSSVGMYWDVDVPFLQHRMFKGIAQYLGFGTEIGIVAAKNHITNIEWASNGAAPLADMRWIMGQYYGELLGFAELPQEQHQIDERFKFDWDMWSVKKRNHAFMVVEDEYRNMYEAFRQFSTRGTRQSFVNVLTPNYALRSYMVENSETFVRDPKAVPSLAPDFSKSQRNLIFSIVMAMVQSGNRISEKEIKRRLRYAGMSSSKPAQVMEELLEAHLDLNDRIGGEARESRIIAENAYEYDQTIREMVTNRYYRIDDSIAYLDNFSSLRNVPIINEEPDGTRLLLGSRLYGHVHQSYLPGQFIVVEGKYYEIVSISESSGVILRRAADHFSRRRYYRQLRHYSIESWEEGQNLGDVRTISSFRVKRIRADISVHTSGYLDMSNYGDLSTAKEVALSNIPDRRYRNKSALRLEFKDASPQVIKTLALLVSEFLVTLFPKDHPYLAVVVPNETELPDSLLYSYSGEREDDVIYIVEDSLIDIGLVSCVDKNIPRIFELCWDFLDWHGDKLAGRIVDEPEVEIELGELPEFTPPKPKENAIERLIGLLRGGKKKAAPAPTPAEDKPSNVLEPEDKPGNASDDENAQSKEAETFDCESNDCESNSLETDDESNLLESDDEGITPESANEGDTPEADGKSNLHETNDEGDGLAVDVELEALPGASLIQDSEDETSETEADHDPEPSAEPETDYTEEPVSAKEPNPFMLSNEPKKHDGEAIKFPPGSIGYEEAMRESEVE